MAQVQPDQPDVVKETRKDELNNTASCVCGKELHVTPASECYNGHTVECDGCKEEIANTSNVYHFPKDSNNILHVNGYNLCISCFRMLSNEINMDTVLFEIWFIINKLSKSIFLEMKSQYEINSIKSLMSKSSYDIFKMVTGINWDNNMNDNIKVFFSKYDELKDDYLSLGNQLKMTEMKNEVDDMKQQIKQLEKEAHDAQRELREKENAKGTLLEDMNTNADCDRVRRLRSDNEFEFEYSRRCRRAPASAKKRKPKSVSHRSRRHRAHKARSKGSTRIKSNKNIGFSLGGAKDINSFRLNINNHEIPTSDSITFEGIFGEYYFDNYENENENDNDDDDNKDNDTGIVTHKTDEGEEKMIDNDNKMDETELPLFYPSYCYSKSMVPNFLRKDNNNNNNSNSTQCEAEDEEYQHFLTIGLNSNIKEKDFSRKKLNLVIVLDISGSMDSKFTIRNGLGDSRQESKIKTARECILLLLTHLNYDDRFGLVLFDNVSEIEIEMKEMCQLKYQQFEDILSLSARGGTNMECGYNEAIRMFSKNAQWINDNNYENRMIFLTDACPNQGATDAGGLMRLVYDAANSNKLSRIYTTFVGIGVDFNSRLISQISAVRGCNYFSVDSKKKFEKKLHSEFDYFVSPMVFNLKLTLFCEGDNNNNNNNNNSNNGCIDKVFGDMSGSINVENGEIMKIDTLFASPPCEDEDNEGVKGGIVLIKLKNENIAKHRQYFIQTTFEDKFGKEFNNMDNIQFNVNDKSSNTDKSEDLSYYGNLGVRKGLLLVRYVLLMKEWIQSSDQAKCQFYPEKFKQFREYFEKEMKFVKDDNLKQEIDIIDKLIKW